MISIKYAFHCMEARQASAESLRQNVKAKTDKWSGVSCVVTFVCCLVSSIAAHRQKIYNYRQKRACLINRDARQAIMQQFYEHWIEAQLPTRIAPITENGRTSTTKLDAVCPTSSPICATMAD